MVRWMYLVAGFVSVALGVIGIALPLLPTVPFMILAAFFFARSSPRFEQMLVEHKVFGPHIVRWREHGAVSRRGKKFALAAFAVSGVVGVVFAPWPWGLVPVAAGVIGATWMWRLPEA